MNPATTCLTGCRVGYVPYTTQFTAPGDRRRFVHYARRRGIDFEIAEPDKDYDVVVLSERADISVWAEWRGGKVVYDLIDSYLAIPRGDFKGRLRGVAKYVFGQSRSLQVDYWRAVADMCRRADAVVCTTAEQKRDIEPYCENAHIVLDMQSMVVAAPKANYDAHSPFRLVWEGLPGTLSSLEVLAPVLARVAAHLPIELVVITDRQYYRHLGVIGRARADERVGKLFPGARWIEWNEGDLASRITECDLAVIPLNLGDPFASGKPENKLLLFWRLGMPVLASATPAYRRAMAMAGLDLLCTGNDEWERRLFQLASDAALRREAGSMGRAHAEAHFSEERLLSAWDAVFHSIGF